MRRMSVHKKARRRFALICAAAALIFVSGCSGRETLPSVRIRAELMPDGSLSVTEEVTYALDGRVRSVSHALEALRADDIADVSADARLPDGSGVIFEQRGEAGLGDSAAMAVQRADDTHLLLTLYHPFPERGSMTLTYRYTLPGMAKRYTDAGTFTWDALGSRGWDVAIARWSLRIAMPVRAEDRLEAALLRMPRQTQSTRSADGLLFTANSVRAGARARIRVDFSPTMLPYVDYEPAPPLAERRAAERADARRVTALGLGWLALCLASTLAAGLLLYRRADHGPRALPPNLRHGPPLGITAPAELSALMPLSGGAGPRDLVAMLLHLIHRNHLALLPPPSELPLTRATMDRLRITRRPAPRDTLLDGEFFLIHWFIDTLGDGKSVTLEQIRRMPKERFLSDYRVWRRLVNEQIAQRPWFENQRPHRRLPAALSMAMLAGTPLVAALGASPAAWWGAPLGALVLTCALRMRRRTPEAAAEVRQWRALQAQIKAGAVHGAKTIAQWERILLYAEALGVGRDASAAMQRAAIANPDGASWSDAREATFLAWPLLAYNDQIPLWFELFCRAFTP